MAVAVAITKSDITQNHQVLFGTFTLSGSYTTDGDTVSFGSTAGLLSSSPPDWIQVFEQPAAASAALGFNYIFAPGTTNANGLLQIFGSGVASTDGGTQIASGVYSGTTPSLSAAVLYFVAWFPRI